LKRVMILRTEVTIPAMATLAPAPSELRSAMRWVE